ncbi:hypothetical protein [Variovorax sp. dw_954]|uniref:hypothetical protein n=1 Tax=Variovorax sp. dw_954 TaxID=2720078 RepID=UPI001BD25BF8|nr:hypothetical protein [Variovorax sp. dw_954]
MINPDAAIPQALAQRHHGARSERVQARSRIDIVHQIVPGGADIRQCKVARQFGCVRRPQLAPRGQLLEGRVRGEPTELQRLQTAQQRPDAPVIGRERLLLAPV